MLWCAHLLKAHMWNLRQHRRINHTDTNTISAFLKRRTRSEQDWPPCRSVSHLPNRSSKCLRSSAPAASSSAGIRYAADGSFWLRRRWRGSLAPAWWSASPARKETKKEEVHEFTINLRYSFQALILKWNAKIKTDDGKFYVNCTNFEALKHCLRKTKSAERIWLEDKNVFQVSIDSFNIW